MAPTIRDSHDELLTYGDKMQPTPEQWWESLRDEERVAFSEAVDMPSLPPELVKKAQAAGIVLVMGPGFATGAGSGGARLPLEYAEHVRQQTTGY